MKAEIPPRYQGNTSFLASPAIWDVVYRLLALGEAEGSGEVVASARIAAEETARASHVPSRLLPP